MNRRPHARLDNWRNDWLWMLSLFLVGLGAKLWLIHRSGTPLPFWDQWEEARVVYIPYFEGRLSLADLFAPSNEHRMFFNWFYALALLLFNGQWDNQVQMVANALLYSAGLTGFAWVMARRLGRNSWPVIVLPLMLALALPIAWENTLAGFHSQVYSAVLVALLTLWLLGGHEPGCYQWGLGVLAALASLCLPTSGIISSAAICALLGLRFIREPRSWKRYWPTLAVCFLIAGCGLSLRVAVPHHRALMAHSATEFLVYLGKYLAWPWIVVPTFAVFNIFPLLTLAWFYLRDRQAPMPGEELVLAVGLWAVLQGAATAYARGAMEYVQWRYMDSSCFITVTNCFSIAFLVNHRLRGSRRRAIWFAAFTLWGVAGVTGLALLAARALQIDIPERQFYQRAQLQHTRAFMATDDPRVFDRKPKPQLPMYEGDPYAPRQVHEGEKLAKALRNPIIRDILPACVRPPLEVRADPEATRGFVTNGVRLSRPEPPTEVCWGSCSGPGHGNIRRFESLPIPQSRLPYLEIPVAGYLGAPNLSLELVDLPSGNRMSVKPAQTAGERWLNCYVPAPAGQFKIVAQDASGAAWFAFKAPREMGRLSFWTIQVLAAWKYLLFAGLGLFLFNLAALRARKRNADL